VGKVLIKIRIVFLILFLSMGLSGNGIAQPFAVVPLTLPAIPVDIQWEDNPIPYKRYLEVRTYLITPVGIGMLGYYVTFVIDTRWLNPVFRYCVFSHAQHHAFIAHTMAIQWIRDQEAHLRIDVYENEAYIDAPVVPDAPRSQSRPLIMNPHPEPHPEREEKTIQSEPIPRGHTRSFHEFKGFDDPVFKDLMILFLMMISCNQ
jgi:hypothetical protein